MQVRWTLRVLSLVGAAVLFGAATSWACTRAAYVDPLSPDHGAPRIWVTVSGGSFNPAPVDIRWGSPTGTMLGRAPNGGGFSVQVRIPDAAPGVYYILAVQTDAAGTTWKRATPFEVTGTSKQEASNGDPGSSQSSNSVATAAPGGTGAQSPSAPPTSADDTAAPAGPAPASGASTPAGGEPTSSASPAPRAHAGAASPRGAASSTAERAAAPRAGAASTAPAPERPTSDRPGEAGVSPLARTVAAELWSGFASDGRPANIGPSLSEPVPAGPHRQVVGLVGLALALTALGGGFFAAEARRRRALA